VLWYVTGNALPQVAIWFIGGSSIRGRKS
jgi:hypothetical protein